VAYALVLVGLAFIAATVAVVFIARWVYSRYHGKD